MRIGFVLPMAISALAGVALGRLAWPGVFEIWALCMLLAGGTRRRLLLGVMALAALPVWLGTGAELPAGLSRQDLRIEGRILEMEPRPHAARLLLAVERCRPTNSRLPACERLRRIRLTFYAAPDMRVGEHWALSVRLRPPGGFANPDAFDYQGWLWREGIDATGYVRSQPPPERLGEAQLSLRQSALASLDKRMSEGVARRWLAALTLGAKERLNDEDWTLLNATGTTHLMVISGLHVGLVATFALWLFRGLARLFTPMRWRMTAWPWGLAGLAALGYAWVAGLEPPALRASIMALVGLWVASGRHSPGLWQGFWLALGLVILIDPLSAWRPGTWLSFAAVAWLILIWRGRARPRGIKGWCWALLRTQLLLAPLMAAASLLAFSRLAPGSVLINLVAVPLVGSLLVPLGLVGWLTWPIVPLSSLCWWGFGQLAAGLHCLLEAVADGLPLWTPPVWMILPLGLALGLGAFLWAAPGLSRRLRIFGSCALLLLALNPRAPEISPGMAQIWVYDVGQGQAVELRTAHHRLLLDTGPRFASGYMPLSGLWPPGRHFDTVVVSHTDLDHAGGLAALESHRVDRFLAPQGSNLEMPYRVCQRGQQWQWDGVGFHVLWPPAGNLEEFVENDRSCVLLVEAGGQRLLVTGDAGREVERRLLNRDSQLLDGRPLDVLVAGHHGSRTSSGEQFATRLSPRHVIYSAGRDNRFNHPAPQVVRRFRRQGSCQWNTAQDGAIRLVLGGAQGVELMPQRHPGVGAVDAHCHRVEFRSRPGAGIAASSFSQLPMETP
ncbi:DNA internalization-related competence protein ComEC/Rec2 [Pistricoccus aurantiacus]|uniref:DNA internalization-related competence protein ComEC/Rec2 n=1 Tax=Pistricoccus aurantiacus TaxID=1883414 RepID=UPI00363FE215